MLTEARERGIPIVSEMQGRNFNWDVTGKVLWPADVSAVSKASNDDSLVMRTVRRVFSCPAISREISTHGSRWGGTALTDGHDLTIHTFAEDHPADARGKGTSAAEAGPEFAELMSWLKPRPTKILGSTLTLKRKEREGLVA